MSSSITMTYAGGGGGAGAVPFLRNYTTGTNSTITLPTRVSGDMLILVVNGDTGTLSTPSGWTGVVSSAPLGSYKRVSDGVEAAPAFPLASSNYRGWLCMSFLGGSAVEDAGVTSYLNSTLTRDAPSVTAADDNRLLLVVGAFKTSVDSTQSIAFPVAMTPVMAAFGGSGEVPGGGWSLRAAQEEVENGATGTRTVTFGASNAVYYHAALSILLQP